MTNITDERPARKTCVALGFFDGLHRGHQAVIGEVFADDALAPAVFTFASRDAGFKAGAELLLSGELKAARLSAMGVEYLYSPDFEELRGMSAADFVRDILVGRLNAARCVCGYDFRFGRGAAADAADLAALCRPFGIAVTVVPPFCSEGQVVSSTAIRALIKDGAIERANALLGYPYLFAHEVIHGNARGRTINTPTINQLLPPSLVVPKFGVYATATEVDGRTYKSVTNIGVRPTVGDLTVPLAETHIIGFDGDLYGRTIPVSLHAFLRGEVRYASFDEMAQQIRRDLAHVKAMRFAY